MIRTFVNKLLGPKGDTGTQGIQGATGAQGAAGVAVTVKYKAIED